jgi:hypothetical protein
VTDQSSLQVAPCVNLRVPPAPERAEATSAPDLGSSTDRETFPRWVVCQICGRRGRWVNPFPEV